MAGDPEFRSWPKSVSFDPREICRRLNRAGVRYVIVGGFATVIHGSPLPTSDVDLVPERSDDNLERLGVALTSLGARLRTADGPVDAPMDGAFLAAMPFMLNLTTDFGDVDLTFEPSGPRRSFADWDVDADDIEIADGLVIRVARLDAVIDSKRSAGRPKDERALPYLESLQEEIHNRTDRSSDQ